jgi:16S rRNA (uracil1498-N3)-methyltransferase
LKLIAQKDSTEGPVADRFYCPGPWRDGRAELEDDEARHLAKVRRVEVGAEVQLFDGKGRAAFAEVVEIKKDRVSLTILRDDSSDRSLPGNLVLATAVPKGDRFDWLIEKATEVGVTRLVPILTARSVVDPRTAKLDRLRRLIIEACKQSGRSRLMELDPPTPWPIWLQKRSGQGQSFLADPGGESVVHLASAGEFAAGIEIAVGPEGGFTAEEVAEAESKRFRRIGLGPTILRIETAAIAACVAVLTVTNSNQ